MFAQVVIGAGFDFDGLDAIRIILVEGDFSDDSVV